MAKREKEKILLPVWDKDEKVNVRIPEIVVYTEKKFGEDEFRTNCNVYYVGDWLNSDIYSCVVVSGEWQFYKDAHFRVKLFTLSPGYYPDLVGMYPILNTVGISSYKCIKP